MDPAVDATTTTAAAAAASASASVDVVMDVTVDVVVDADAVPSIDAPQFKKRKTERREKLRKTAICKHFGTPQGCPFPNCRFAHGRVEVQDNEESQMLAAQRKFIRDQVGNRSADRFKQVPGGGDGEGDERVARRGTMIERYYTELFACDVMGRLGEDHYVHMHSNRLCVVGVAPSHPVMQQEIKEIVFTQHVLDSKVSGKKKRGGQFMLPHAILCHIKCASGAVYAVRSCIRGTLLEFNARVAENPTLLQSKHDSDGYLVIIQPKTNEVVEIQESLLSKDEYKIYHEEAAAATNQATVIEVVEVVAAPAADVVLQ